MQSSSVRLVGAVWTACLIALPGLAQDKDVQKRPVVVALDGSQTVAMSTGTPLKAIHDASDKPINRIERKNKSVQVQGERQKDSIFSIAADVNEATTAVVRGLALGESSFTLIDTAGRRESFQVIVATGLEAAVDSSHRVRLSSTKTISRVANHDEKVSRVGIVGEKRTIATVTALAAGDGHFVLHSEDGQKEHFKIQVYSLEGKNQRLLVAGGMRLQMSNKKRLASVFVEREEIVKVTPSLEDLTAVDAVARHPGTCLVTLTDADGKQESVRLIVLKGDDLFVPVDGSRTVQLTTGSPVRIIRNQDEKVTSVKIDQSDARRVLIRGLAPGETSIILFGEEGNPELYRVVVRSETEPGKHVLFLPFGKRTEVELPVEKMVQSVANFSDKVRVEPVAASGSITIVNRTRWIRAAAKPNVRGRTIALLARKPGVARLHLTLEGGTTAEIVAIVGDGRTLQIAVDSTHRLQLDGKATVTKVDSSGAKLIRASLADDRTAVLVTGLAEGEGQLVLHGQDGRKEHFTIEVYSLTGSGRQFLLLGERCRAISKTEVRAAFSDREDLVDVQDDLLGPPTVHALAEGVSRVTLQDADDREEKSLFLVLKGGNLFVPVPGKREVQLTTKAPIRSIRTDGAMLVEAQVDPTDRTRVILEGLTAGETRLLISGEEGNPEMYRLIVCSEKSPPKHVVFVPLGKSEVRVPVKMTVWGVINPDTDMLAISGVKGSGIIGVTNGDRWSAVDDVDTKATSPALIVNAHKPGVARLMLKQLGEAKIHNELILIVRDDSAKKK